MALINCPECGIKLSSKAEACPQCGHPIRRRIKVVERVERKGPRQVIVQQTNKGCFEGCNGCVGQLIYGLLGLWILGMILQIFK